MWLGGSQLENGEDPALVILPEPFLEERTPGVSLNSWGERAEEKEHSSGRAGRDSGRETCLYPHFSSTVNKPRAKGLIRLLKQPVNFI